MLKEKKLEGVGKNAIENQHVKELLQIAYRRSQSKATIRMKGKFGDSTF
jgi:hypothetical protein